MSQKRKPSHHQHPFLLVFFSILFLFSPLFAEERVPWKLDESYNGQYLNDFNRLRYQVPNIMRQTTIDLAVRLGLNFQEGWRYPLAVVFEDGAPMDAENILAYVQLYQTSNGIFQKLVINLRAYSDKSFDFEKVFAHELTHAMVNDEIGAAAAQYLPRWFHEGIAVYGAEQGENMLETYVHQTTGFSESQLLNGLETHVSGLDYAEDYLAFKYIFKKHGPNSLHNFVREVIKRKGDIPGALEYTCFETWAEFIENVDKFGRDEIKRIGPARKRDLNRRPY